LSPEERQGLKKFAESPFFNQRPEASRLLDVLLLSLKKGRATPGKEQVFQQVFDGRPFEDHRLRMAISFAYQLVRRYLTVQDFLEDEVQLAIRESEVLRRRKLYALSRHCLDSARNALDGQTVRNADFFDQEYRLLLEECRLEMTRPSAQPEQLQALSEQLDKAFLSRKLWQNCVLLSHQNMAKSDFSPGLLDQVLDNLDEPAVPAIAIYYRYYRALTQSENSAAHYQHFKAMLFEHGEIFSEEELRDLYLLAINFCIKQYNAGNQAFLREQLELYQRGLEHKYFLVAGELSAYTYLNVVTLALVLQELDWAGQFIEGVPHAAGARKAGELFQFQQGPPRICATAPRQCPAIVAKSGVQGGFAWTGGQNPATQNLLRIGRVRPARRTSAKPQNVFIPQKSDGLPPRKLYKHHTFHTQTARNQTLRSGCKDCAAAGDRTDGRSGGKGMVAGAVVMCSDAGRTRRIVGTRWNLAPAGSCEVFRCGWNPQDSRHEVEPRAGGYVWQLRRS
jgi:hypothetical protein